MAIITPAADADRKTGEMYGLQRRLLALPSDQINAAVLDPSLSLEDIAKFGGPDLVRIFGARLREVLGTLDSYSQGRLMLFQGNLEAARAAFERAVAEENESVKSHCNLAATLIKQGDVEGACRNFEIAAEMGDPFARLNLITLYEVRGQAQTLIELEKLAELGEQGITLILNSANQYTRVNRELAIILFEFLATKFHPEALGLLLGYYSHNRDMPNFQRLLSLADTGGYELVEGQLREKESS